MRHHLICSSAHIGRPADCPGSDERGRGHPWSRATTRRAGSSATADSDGLVDCQVDCQLPGVALFRLNRSGRMHAAELVIWTAMNRPEHAGKS